MTIDRLARDYLQKLQATVGAAGGRSLELATRPVVHSFLEAAIRHLRPGVLLHHESQVDPMNRPDWWLEDPETFGVFAYADHKGLSQSQPLQLSERERGQVQRYLRLGRPVFVFDGVEFLFFQPGSTDPERIELVPKPLGERTVWSKLPINPTVEARLQTLLDAPGFRRWTEAELVEQLALRARLLSGSIAPLLEAPRGSGATQAEEDLLAALHCLRDLASRNHDPSLADSGACADFVAQVLVFGLFYAHTMAPVPGDSPVARRLRIQSFWSGETFKDEAQKLRPFRTITDLLGSTLSAGNALGVWYGEAAGVLAHAEYMGTDVGPTDFHVLFERFFEAFDPEARFDRGVFYTPSVVARWMARKVETLLAAEFGGGMADGVDKVIDPCAGTGGFLEAVVEIVGDQPSRTHFVGLEVLPAPYALAHYRMSRVTAGWANPPRVSIALTDTLSDQIANPPTGGSDGFSDELAEAAALARPPVRVVIGNPPSSIHVASGAPRRYIEKMLDDFRPPAAHRRARSNIQQGLNNEAFRFLRWSAERIIASGTGVLALVLPGAFAGAVSYSYARKWILDTFDHVDVLLLDSDVRMGEAVGESMFRVLQGRLVLFAVRTARPPVAVGRGVRARVRVRDITGLRRAEKGDLLGGESGEALRFTAIDPTGPHWRLQIPGGEANGSWGSCWPLRDADGDRGIFVAKCSAVKLAPTALLFHTERSILVRRSASLAARSGGGWARTAAEVRDDWWKGQEKPPAERKLSDDVRLSAADAVKKARAISDYTFRPFVDGFVLEDDALFAAVRKSGGDGTRARPEVRAAFSQGARGIAVAPAPADLGPSLTRFVSFCWALPDNDISARGNAMVFADRFPAQKQRSKWDSTARENIHSEFSELFDRHDDAIFYVYAVMSCPTYLEVYEQELYQPADPEHPPRVPVAESSEERLAIAKLGRRIAECERAGTPGPKLRLTTSWPPGLQELKLHRTVIDPEGGTVTLAGTDGESVTVSGIPQDVLSMRISGHAVVDKWLRERKFAYLRRTFRSDDLEAFNDLLSRIAEQQTLLAEVSQRLDRILTSETLLSPPQA